jgi:EAL domain-containing protein (putative c-di-GMP-specific phosphodiesterase class I)
MIEDLAQSKKTLEVIHAIDMLAKSLSMQLVIQGVDTEKQLLKLQELNIDLVQGQFVGEARLENTEL